MKNEEAIGIDLGTTNSVVSIIQGSDPTIIPNDEGNRTTPSVVAFTPKNERKVGNSAKRQAVTNPEFTFWSFKRFMGSKFDENLSKDLPYTIMSDDNNNTVIKGRDKNTYRPEQLSATVLTKLKKDAEAYLGKEIKNAVITVPAYFNNSQRQATKEAGIIAGLNVLRIINEPTAAAIAYGLDKQDKEGIILVADIGGGTSDFTILEHGDQVFEVLATNGDMKLGGDDVDRSLINYIAEEFKKKEGIDIRKDAPAHQRVKEAAEKAKAELSSVKSTEINLPFITAKDNQPLHLQQTVTRAKLEDLITPFTQRISNLLEEVLKKAKIQKEKLTEVILVGGSTRIPKIQEIIEKVTGRKPSKGINPDEAVALGAAIQAGLLSGNLKDNIVLLDKTPLSLGIETQGGVFSKMIEQGTTIPTQKTQTFSTAQDNQPNVEIHILEGERPLVKDNHSLGRFNLEGIPPKPRGVPQIEVTLKVDANGILDVHAKDKETGKDNKIRIEGSSKLSKEEIERMKQEAKDNEAADRKEKEKIDKLNAADGLILHTEKQLKELKDKLSEDNKKAIEKSLEELKKAYAMKDLAKIDEHSKALEKTWQKTSEEIYKTAQNAKQQDQNQTSDKEKNSEPEATEAEFEEVKK